MTDIKFDEMFFLGGGENFPLASVMVLNYSAFFPQHGHLCERWLFTEVSIESMDPVHCMV